MKVKTIKKLSIIGVLITIVFGSLFAVWYKGGHESSNVIININTGKPAENVVTLFYRGIKIPKTPFILFKRYYSIVERDWPLGRITAIQYQGIGYNPFLTVYEGGTIAGTGYCMVEKTHDQIFPVLDDVREGEFYNTQGQLVSSVKDGTGIIPVFCSEGQKIWETELKDFKRVRLRRWDKKGILKFDKKY